jgi:hypothetical protein
LEANLVIQQIAPDALLPSDARRTARANDFANAQIFARELALKLDIAQQLGQEGIEMRFGENHQSVHDKAAIVAEIDRIIQLIRDALPHQAAKRQIRRCLLR